MKHYTKLLLALFMLVILNDLQAQSIAQGINYQAIAEDASGEPVVSHAVGIKISIYSGSATGALEWEETHLPATNQFGLFSIVIGQGTTTGNGSASSFSLIGWGAADHYLKVSMDITGGTTYVDMDNSQLLSVPYALYSAKAGSLSGPVSINDLTDVDTTGVLIGKTLKWNGSQWLPANDNNNDTAQFAYISNTAGFADTAMYATNLVNSDTSLYAHHSDSSAYSNASATSQNAVNAVYSDTATYALNCANTTNDWHIAGNTGITAPTNFVGTINAADLVFKTNNAERMRITSAGKLGIGTTAPTASVHMVGNDGFISQGTFGTGTALAFGAGTRMMWYPKRAAFRAGFVTSTQWDDVNIGNYSFASGYSSTAKGIGAVAMGQTSSASDSCAVAIGFSATASGKYSVAMGNIPIASGYAAVALGRGPIASGYASAAIGYHVTASGDMSTVFGYYSTASGDNSVAMGYRSSTNNMNGSFIFADASSTNVVTNSTAPNQFLVKASGGTIFYSNAALTSGVSLAAGGGAWLTVSDRTKKEHFKQMNAEAVLKKIAEMEITSWNYKTQSPEIRHIGPMAQDFYASFKLGESDTTITTTDIDGINMLAIQALARKTTELKKQADEVKELKAEIEKLSKDKKNLEKRIIAIEEKLILNNEDKFASREKH